MTGAHHPAEPTTRAELIIERLLDAPRELVFEVWTDPRHLIHWWGPKDFLVPHIDMDVRTGGRYRICIQAPDGTAYWMSGVYRDVTPPERLEYTFAWDRADGTLGHEMLISVRFEARGNRTAMLFHQTLFDNVKERDDHNEGWSECFDRLEQFLATLREA